MNQEYNRSLVFFINNIFYSAVRHGKKLLMWKFFFHLIYLIKSIFKKNILWFFNQVKINLHPRLYLRVQHLGAIPYKIPVISIRKSYFLSKKWILNSLGGRRERTFILKLFSELRDIRNKKGLALEKRKDYYKEIRKSLPNLRYLRYVELYQKTAYQIPVLTAGVKDRRTIMKKLKKQYDFNLFKKK